MRSRWVTVGSLLLISLAVAAAVGVDAAPVRSDATTTTTTTMDPLDEFCQEACKAGVGGPECGCPDHPIG